MYDVSQVTKAGYGSGVHHGDVIVRLVDAVAGTDEDELVAARDAFVETLGPAALVDAAAIVATFNQMDRIADATGIPLDAPLELATQRLREEIGADRYASAANTPPTGAIKRAVSRSIERMMSPFQWRVLRAAARWRR